MEQSARRGDVLRRNELAARPGGGEGGEPDQREILFDLELATRSAFQEQEKSPLFDRLAKTKANLMRLWVED